MYCPNCGAQNKKKQNFCRYCGLHLREVEKTFSNQLIFGGETKRLKNLRNVRKITDYAQFYSFVTLVVGVIALVFSDSGIGKTLLTAGLLSYFLAQIIREIFGYFQRQSSGVNERENVSVGTEKREFETRETNKLIEEKPFIPVPSVTENSTELLFANNKPNVAD